MVDDLLDTSDESSVPPVQDVVCRRIPPVRLAPGMRVFVSLPQFLVSHSPDGFEWGYGGSGPNDLALAILTMHVPPGADGLPVVPLSRGKTSQVAWHLHHDFCADVVSKLPDRGGTISVASVREWLAQRWTRERGFADERLRETVKQDDEPEVLEE